MHVTTQFNLHHSCSYPQGPGQEEARASHGNHTSPQHLLKSQVCKGKGWNLPGSDGGSLRWRPGLVSEQESWGGWLLIVQASKGGRGMILSFFGGGGRAGWAREVSGEHVAVTPHLSCCCPESKPWRPDRAGLVPWGCPASPSRSPCSGRSWWWTLKRKQENKSLQWFDEDYMSKRNMHNRVYADPLGSCFISLHNSHLLVCFVGLFDCKQDYTKTTEHISRKLWKGMEYGSGRNQENVGADPGFPPTHFLLQC